MSKAKKVIFVIVEGPTDEDALSSVLKQIFSSAEVHFHVIHGDITTEDAITANNAKSYVAKRIAAEMKKYAYENMKNYKIAVAGTGYVGLSLSVLLAQHNQVMCA